MPRVTDSFPGYPWLVYGAFQYNSFPLNWIKCIVFGAKSLHSNAESPSPVGQPKRIRVFLGIADHQQCSAQQPLGLSVLVYNNIGNSDVMIRNCKRGC